MIQRIQSTYLLIAGLLPAIFPLIGTTRIGILAVCCCLAVIPFICIFLYKKRKIQMTLCRICIVIALLLYALHFYPGTETGSYWKLIVPATYQLLNLLAFRAIRHDERLVRAADRIR